jgi:hypothetical protein
MSGVTLAGIPLFFCFTNQLETRNALGSSYLDMLSGQKDIAKSNWRNNWNKAQGLLLRKYPKI